MQKYIFELIRATDLFGKVNTKIAKLPNPYILTYILEAIDSISSNDIEGIHTTLDEAYEGIVRDKDTPFYMYRETLKNSHKRLIAHELIRIEDIKYINRSIRGVDGELRKGPVSIKDSEGNVVHNPPQANELPKLMEEIVQLINQDREKNQVLNALDIHHKFEHAHPFSDGNGRTGRILFALLLEKLKIDKVRLLTNNPLKVSVLEKHGIKVDRVEHIFKSNEHAKEYLKTKKAKMGHEL